MNLWDIITGKWWVAVQQAFGWVGDKIVKYQDGQDALRNGKLEKELAELKASSELAAYKARSDIEWDLKWADGAMHSWKDEFILILWSVPLIGLFLPILRPFVIDGFEYLKSFNPDAPNWYLAGWGIIFAATFGLRQALQFMMPAKYAALATAIGNIKPDVPEDAIAAIDARLSGGGATAPKPAT